MDDRIEIMNSILPFVYEAWSSDDESEEQYEEQYEHYINFENDYEDIPEEFLPKWEKNIFRLSQITLNIIDLPKEIILKIILDILNIKDKNAFMLSSKIFINYKSKIEFI